MNTEKEDLLQLNRSKTISGQMEEEIQTLLFAFIHHSHRRGQMEYQAAVSPDC